MTFFRENSQLYPIGNSLILIIFLGNFLEYCMKCKFSLTIVNEIIESLLVKNICISLALSLKFIQNVIKAMLTHYTYFCQSFLCSVIILDIWVKLPRLNKYIRIIFSFSLKNLCPKNSMHQKNSFVLYLLERFWRMLTHWHSMESKMA